MEGFLFTFSGKMGSKSNVIDSEVTVSPVSGQDNMSAKLSVQDSKSQPRPVSCASHSSSEESSENNWTLFLSSYSPADTASFESSK